MAVRAMESSSLNDENTKNVKREKNIEQVVTPVDVQKKSVVKKFAETFLQNNVKSVKEYIFEEVMVPALKSAVSEIVTQGVDMFLYGGTSNDRGGYSSSRNRSRSSYVSYNNVSNDRYANSRSHTREASRANKVHHFDDIIFGSAKEAETVLDCMYSIIDEYDFVSVSDLYDLVGITASFTDNRWGWHSLAGAYVHRAPRNGWVITFPNTEPLE